MNQVEIVLPRLHKTQKYANEHSRRFNLYNCGRRWGKDILLEKRRILAMINAPSPYGWFAPTYRMMKENYQAIYNYVAPLILRASASDYRLELVNGATLDFWSLDNYDAARGRKYRGVTVNETASAPNMMDAWNYVIRPTLADLQGGADFGSTPKGMNAFYQLWIQAENNPEWAKFHYTTYDNGKYIPVSEIEAMKASLPERVFRQEIMAEFLKDGSFFQNVDECCVIDVPDNPDNHKRHRFTAGLDWALSDDFTRLTIICANCGRVVDWWGGNRMDYTMQRQFIIDKLNQWPGVVLLPERNSMGAPNIESLISAGMDVGRGTDGGAGFNTTSSNKSELIMRLALAMEKREIKLPREYADELRAYEVTVTAANPKFSAPSGLHDDRVISAALSWWLCTDAIQISTMPNPFYN